MNEERIPVLFTEEEWIKIANIIQKEPLKDVFNIFIGLDQQIGQYKQQKSIEQMELQKQMEKATVDEEPAEGPKEK